MEWEIFNSVNCHLCPASRIEEKNEKKKEKKNEIIGLSKNDRRSAFKPEKVLREQESLAVWTAGGSKLDVWRSLFTIIDITIPCHYLHRMNMASRHNLNLR